MNDALTGLIVAGIVLAACGGTDGTAATDSVTPAAAVTSATNESETPDDRVERIAAEVDAWAASGTLDEARAHAEAAANLVVGPGGLGYGDRDGDGSINGEVTVGLLPGPTGSPAGLVLDQIGPSDCVNRDVLGGDWSDPVARWDLLADAIAEWSTVNNPFPALPSHPMRIVGWATLAQTSTFDDAIEFSGHADLHVDVSRNALADC